jgi:alpha-beta hydrolase superfamily lysophospholipase
MFLLKTYLAILAAFLTVQIASAQSFSAKICPSPWQSAIGNLNDCSLQEFTLKTWSGWTGAQWDVKAKIRSGHLAENPNVPFRGNVIYYEGLADSMVNHMPLFQKLTQAGYRVIAFDYMGQGGSSGSMNDTRILQIGTLGDKIWNLEARDLASYPKKNIIGWSTGGLAAYIQAGMKTDVNNIILIAPGIVPNIKVGEQHILEFKFNQITLPTLTTQIYLNDILNPHIDPIKPRSPLDVMDFSWDLTITASAHRDFPMNSQVNGFVLLSGDNDTYVNARKTFSVLKKVAPHFLVRQYTNALHEIDNEAEPNRSNAHQDILNFLNSCN